MPGRLRRLATGELTPDEIGTIRALMTAAVGDDDEERFEDGAGDAADLDLGVGGDGGAGEGVAEGLGVGDAEDALGDGDLAGVGGVVGGEFAGGGGVAGDQCAGGCGGGGCGAGES